MVIFIDVDVVKSEKLIITALVLLVIVEVVVDKGIEVVVVIAVGILNVVGAVVVFDISEGGFSPFFSASHNSKMKRNTIMKIVVSFSLESTSRCINDKSPVLV